MVDVRSQRFVRLRLEALEDRLAPTIAPVFADEGVANAAYVNLTANLTTPVVGVASDNSFDVAWVYTNPSTGLGEIYARQFNGDGTAKGASFLVASATVSDSQPAISVAADGTFVIAYTKAISSTEDDVFFQIYSATGTQELGETAAPTNSGGGTPDDFSPSVAISNTTDQFIIAWEQQSSPTNSTIWACVFQADGTPTTNGDTAVATTAGEASDPQVVIGQSTNNSLTGTFASVISYSLNEDGIQEVFFRRYYSGLSAIDTGPVGIAVSGTTSSIESQAAIAIDTNGNLLVAWTSQPSGGASQVLYQEFTSGDTPLFTFFQQFDTAVAETLSAPGYVDNYSSLNETDPQVVAESDGSFLVAFVGTPTSGGTAGQIYYQEMNAALVPVGTSTVYSSENNPSNTSPSLASSGNGFYVIAADNLVDTNPNAIVRGFETLADHVGVVRPTASGLAEFSLDSDGNDTFDANDSVFTFGYYTDQFVIGDWNGAGYDEIGVVRPYGIASIWSLDTNGDGKFDAGDQVFVYGLATDQFVIGDWNGAGKDEIGVVRQTASGLEWVLNTSGSGVYSSSSSAVDFYGEDGDTPVVGDWTGSGKDEIGVVRPTASGALQWVLNTSDSGAYSSSDAVCYFGSVGDTPIVGDWTGSGITEIGVVVPQANGTSTVILDTNGDGVMDAGDTSFTFGLSTDKFIVGKWKPTALAEYAALTGPGGVAPLTEAQLAAIVQLAINDWAAAGLNAQQIALLDKVHFQIAELPDNLLGLTEGNTIDISNTADGWGWNLGAGTLPPNRMDLQTTVSHELGHVLGLPDIANVNDVMSKTLSPGTRHLPDTQDVDAVFAEMGMA